MKKTLLMVLPFIMLSACGSNGNQNSDSQNTLLRKESISKEDFKNHFGYIEEWNSNSIPDYSEHKYTYETVLSLTITQLRTGFVTYSGTAQLNAAVHWTYNDYYKGTSEDKEIKFSISFSIKDSAQTFLIKKEFSTVHYWDETEYVPESEIPYYRDYYLAPYVTSDAPSSIDIVATYHNNGISGMDNLFYTSIEINVANYTAYFDITADNIMPIGSEPLYDYRVTFVINGKNYSSRRDGTLVFNPPFASKPRPENVFGYIDIYPGRVI